jgi:hypothetical protein
MVDNYVDVVEASGKTCDDGMEADSNCSTPQFLLTPESGTICSEISQTSWHSIHYMVEAIIQSKYFNSIVDNLLSGIRTHAGEKSVSSAKDNSHGTNHIASPNDNSSLGRRKRRTGGSDPTPPDGGDDGEDSDDSDQGRDKDSKKRRRAPESPPRRFACPFFKYDQNHFKEVRPCLGPGWLDCHRVK